MINLETLFAQESVIDIVTFHAGLKNGIDYRMLDRKFVQYRFEVIATGELLSTVNTLCREGIIQDERGSMVFTKGSNWKEPLFSKEKKHGIK
ncbi:hypothetical protein [Pseudomonas sp. LS-2]|uniref:hypothetical protein n=1 Tax=Pseudomonas sp. LS-2 TaxID=2315859 RepID=UPI001C49BA0A|nr:hypothetical protein [Pseudomonas sp. LS-2]